LALVSRKVRGSFVFNMTKNLALTLSALSLLSSAAFSPVAFALPAKTYQVTGPIVDINAKTITVMKGKEKWEIARDTPTEVPDDIKAGDKVTVQYYMTATTVEKKDAKPGKKK
jgi:hypothetical protein